MAGLASGTFAVAAVRQPRLFGFGFAHNVGLAFAEIPAWGKSTVPPCYHWNRVFLLLLCLRGGGIRAAHSTAGLVSWSCPLRQFRQLHSSLVHRAYRRLSLATSAVDAGVVRLPS